MIHGHKGKHFIYLKKKLQLLKSSSLPASQGKLARILNASPAIDQHHLQDQRKCSAQPALQLGGRKALGPVSKAWRSHVPVNPVALIFGIKTKKFL